MEDKKLFKFIEQRYGTGNYTLKEHTYVCPDHSQWIPIVLQFAAFLEGTGYVGVYERLEAALFEEDEDF